MASPPFTSPCMDKVKDEAIDIEVHSLLSKAAVEVFTDTSERPSVAPVRLEGDRFSSFGLLLSPYL